MKTLDLGPPRIGAPVGIGIDVGGTNIKIAAVADNGVGSVDSRPTPMSGTSDVITLLAEMWQSTRKPGTHPPTVVAIPGPVPEPGASLFVPNLPGDWRGVDLVAEITDVIGVEPDLVNDAHAYATGEARFGACRGRRDAVVITLGTGVGGGVILDGRLHRGATGRAGEMGHVVVEPDGVPCVCGNRGCLETVASAGAMVRHGGGEDGANLPAVAERARSGEPVAAAAFLRAGVGLGIALTAVAAIVAAEVAVVGGGAGRAVFDLIAPHAGAVLARRAELMEPMDLAPAELAEMAGAIGAAVHAKEVAR